MREITSLLLHRSGAERVDRRRRRASRHRVSCRRRRLQAMTARSGRCARARSDIAISSTICPPPCCRSTRGRWPRSSTQLRREGVTDIGPYLDDTPELVALQGTVVRSRTSIAAPVQLFGGRQRRSDLIGPVDFLFAASPETASRVITAHFDGRAHLYRGHEAAHASTVACATSQLSVTYPTPPERLDVTLISLEDITDRLRTEAQLRQLQADYHARGADLDARRARHLDRARGQPAARPRSSPMPRPACDGCRATSPIWTKVGQLTSRIAGSARHASDIVQRIRGHGGPARAGARPCSI